jgi:hypothetical protein
MKVTKTTSREDYLAHLVKNAGKNIAILKHVAKIEKMDDAAWEAHREHLIEMSAAFAEGTSGRLAKSIK